MNAGKAAYVASMSPTDELDEGGVSLGEMATGLGLLAGFLWT